MQPENVGLVMVDIDDIETRIAKAKEELQAFAERFEAKDALCCSSCGTEMMYGPAYLRVQKARCSTCISKDAQIEQIVRPDKTPRRERRKAQRDAQKQEERRSTARS